VIEPIIKEPPIISKGIFQLYSMLLFHINHSTN